MKQSMPMLCITSGGVSEALPFADTERLQNHSSPIMTGGGEKMLEPGGPRDAVMRLKRELDERVASRKRRANSHGQPAPVLGGGKPAMSAPGPVKGDVGHDGEAARQHPASPAPLLTLPPANAPVQLPIGPDGAGASAVTPPLPPPSSVDKATQTRPHGRRLKGIADRVQ